MSTNLTQSSNGQAMIASFRELPWHGAGEVFTEEVTGVEMLQKAHLDWDVLEAPVMTQVGTMISKATGWDAATDTPNIWNIVWINVMENVDFVIDDVANASFFTAKLIPININIKYKVLNTFK